MCNINENRLNRWLAQENGAAVEKAFKIESTYKVSGAAGPVNYKVSHVSNDV